VLESTASQSVRLSRIGWRTRGSVCVRPGAAHSGSHTSQKARCMRHPRLGGWFRLFRERSRNVPWNQRLHKVCTYRGLVGAHVAVLAMCASEGYSSRPRTHRKKRDVGATPDWEEGFRLCRLSGTKPECALESTASQSERLSRIVWAP